MQYWDEQAEMTLLHWEQILDQCRREREENRQAWLRYIESTSGIYDLNTTIPDVSIAVLVPLDMRHRLTNNSRKDSSMDAPTPVTVRYERGHSFDRKNGTITWTGTYVILERHPGGMTWATAYESSGKIHWPRRILAPYEEAEHLDTGMWYVGDQVLPPGF